MHVRRQRVRPCTFDLLTVTGGDWSFVALREADLSGLRASGATLRSLDLSGATLEGADLSGADLRGSDLSAVDPRSVRLADAQIDVPQAVALVTVLGLRVQPDAPE